MAEGPTYEELERRIQELERKAALHKRVEEELRENEERLRRFFEDDLTGDFITGGDGMILECNPAFLKIFGYEDKSEVLNQNITTMYPEPSERAFILSELAAKGKLEHYETTRKRKDGSLITVDENIVATLKDGKLLEVRGYIYDITDRKMAEEALRRSEERLLRIYDSGMIGIIYWTPDGRITDANHKFLNMVGYTREDLETGRIVEPHRVSFPSRHPMRASGNASRDAE